jgi:hypothetical protein
MLGLLFCAPTGDETGFECGREECLYHLSRSKAKKAEEEAEILLFDIYFFIHPYLFFSSIILVSFWGSSELCLSNLFSQ